MFKILEITECPNIDDGGGIHIKVLFDNLYPISNSEKTFCTTNCSRKKYIREIELYYVINNVFNIVSCNCDDCKCDNDVFYLSISDEEMKYGIYYSPKRNKDKPYCYSSFEHNITEHNFKELPELIDFIREKHPELLKQVKLAIHEE